jgi:hypothetical protein
LTTDDSAEFEETVGYIWLVEKVGRISLRCSLLDHKYHLMPESVDAEYRECQRCGQVERLDRVIHGV